MSQADQLIRQREALPLTSPRRREFNTAIYGLTHSELAREVMFRKAWEAEFAAAVREIV